MKLPRIPALYGRALTLLLLITAPFTAGGAEIAYIDAQRLIEEAPQGQAEQKRLEEEFSDRKLSIEGKFQDLQDQTETLGKDRLTMSEEELTAKSRELGDLQREFKRDQQAYNEDYAQRRGEGLRKLEKIITEAIIIVAKQEEIDMVLQQVVYASPDIDFTAKVLSELEKRAK